MYSLNFVTVYYYLALLQDVVEWNNDLDIKTDVHFDKWWKVFFIGIFIIASLDLTSDINEN